MAHTKNWIRKEKRLAIYLRDGLACAYCGARQEQPGVMLSLDHLVCRTHGGGNGEGNLITACHACNTNRRDMPLSEWLIKSCGDDAAKTARYITEHTGLDLAPYRAEANKIIARRMVDRAKNTSKK